MSPDFTLGKSVINNNSTQQSEISVDKSIINFNSDKIKDLLHTKVIEAKFADKITSNNWRSILDTGIKLAFNKGFSVESLQDNLIINFKEGNHNLQGFSPIEGSNYSWQNQDSNRAANNALNLAKLLGCEIYVLFEWREKGKFPMKQGLIHWKP